MEGGSEGGGGGSLHAVLGGRVLVEADAGCMLGGGGRGRGYVGGWVCEWVGGWPAGCGEGGRVIGLRMSVGRRGDVLMLARCLVEAGVWSLWEGLEGRVGWRLFGGGRRGQGLQACLEAS